MKKKYYWIVGLILIIIGFAAFPYVYFFSFNCFGGKCSNVSQMIIVTILGIILIIAGIIVAIIFRK